MTHLSICCLARCCFSKDDKLMYIYSCLLGVTDKNIRQLLVCKRMYLTKKACEISRSAAASHVEFFCTEVYVLDLLLPPMEWINSYQG